MGESFLRFPGFFKNPVPLGIAGSNPARGVFFFLYGTYYFLKLVTFKLVYYLEFQMDKL